MENDQGRAWELFLRTGRVSDYMRYRQAGCSMRDSDFIEDEDDPDAEEYTGGGDRLKGY